MAGMDADLCLLDSSIDIDTVIAKGKVMVSGKKPLVFGTFEKVSN
jgi:beta-aspartyl-dipeptidase (metallo-type)